MRALLGAALLLPAVPLLAGAARADDAVCPAVHDDYQFCADDLESDNCADFVEDAARLAALFQHRVELHPDREDELRITTWWGCGDETLAQIAALLRRLGTPRAKEVLEDEPYRSFAAPAAPPPQAPHAVDPCLDTSVAEHDACVANELASAEAEHEKVLEACEKKVAPGLKQELLQAESDWKATLQIECDGDEGCMAGSTRERTQSILQAHPECAPSH